MADFEGATSGMGIYQRSKWTGETHDLENNYKPETATEPQIDMLNFNCNSASTANPKCTFDIEFANSPDG